MFFERGQICVYYVIYDEYSPKKNMCFIVWERKLGFLTRCRFLIDFGLNFDPFGYRVGCNMDPKNMQMFVS